MFNPLQFLEGSRGKLVKKRISVVTTKNSSDQTKGGDDVRRGETFSSGYLIA